MLPTAEKYFCISCHSIQQYEEHHCISCREPVIQIYKNDRFPKHPKKADFEFICGSVVSRIEHNMSHYGSMRREWSRDFMDRLRDFGKKYSKNHDKYISVMDNLDGYWYEKRLDEHPNAGSIWHTIDSVNLPDYMQKFTTHKGVAPKRKEIYSFGATMFAFEDRSMSFNIRADEKDWDLFKVHKTNLYSKNGMEYLKDMQKVYKWDGTLFFPFKFFGSKREATIYRNELAKFITKNEPLFDEYVIIQAEKINTTMDMSKNCPEYMI